MAAPEPILKLAAANATDGIALTWPRPTTYADGTRMTDLGAFRIERRAAEGPFATVATVRITDRERFRQERRFRWIDIETTAGETYEYRVVSETTDGYVSQPSNAVTIERAIPTPAPRRTPTRSM
jgi:hypothetical protein